MQPPAPDLPPDPGLPPGTEPPVEGTSKSGGGAGLVLGGALLALGLGFALTKRRR